MINTTCERQANKRTANGKCSRLLVTKKEKKKKKKKATTRTASLFLLPLSVPHQCKTSSESKSVYEINYFQEF
jgi:hypothetical protein